jgi:hypothetical protein
LAHDARSGASGDDEQQTEGFTESGATYATSEADFEGKPVVAEVWIVPPAETKASEPDAL